jgi:hypothetical protein
MFGVWKILGMLNCGSELAIREVDGRSIVMEALVVTCSFRTDCGPTLLEPLARERRVARERFDFIRDQFCNSQTTSNPESEPSTHFDV